MKRPWARALAGALALFAAAARANAADEAGPSSPPPAPDGSPRPVAPEPTVVSPLTGNVAELPAQPPAYQTLRPSGKPGNAPPIPADSGATAQSVPRGPYVHDGLFARLSVGPGLFQGSSGTAPDTRSFSAGAVSIDAAFGGSPARGFALGGSVQTNRLFSLTSADDIVDGDEPDLTGVSFSLTALSIFADYYPEPTDGLHFLASIGLGWLDVSRSGDSAEKSPSGVLLGLGGGYEWFVGPNISLGVLLRGNLGIFSVTETNTQSSTNVTAFIPALLATATYN